MQGRRRPRPVGVVAVSLDEFVPKRHRLRRIDKVLDLAFVYQLTRPRYAARMGRTSIDPVMFFKMQVIKYFYGIKSDRQLCEDIQVNLAYRWFLRLAIDDPVPEHSSLTRIRDRLGEDIFRRVFEKIVTQCQKAGLVKGKQMLTDATLIEANAANKSLTERPRRGRPRKHPELDRDGKPKKKRVSMATHVSKTDPDATIVGRKGKPKRLYYKSHCTIDGAHRVITDCHVTTGAKHESTVFKDRVTYQMRRFHLAPDEWLADRGYGHGPAYKFLRDRGVTPYIPLRDNKLGRGKFAPTRGFRYDRKADVYRCPFGYVLTPHTPSNGFTRYVITGGECRTCPFRASCLKGHGKIRSRRVQRSDFQDEFDQIHRRRETDHFKRKLKQRSWKMEGIFGEDKDNHGLGRAHYRGLAKVQEQVYMIAVVHNLKRLAYKGRAGRAIIWLRLCDERQGLRLMPHVAVRLRPSQYLICETR